ncbi:MAG: amphi-Trp domain-containing protein [Gemmatimonadota bacterium]|jgi:amphi-Trp domain-containing protein
MASTSRSGEFAHDSLQDTNSIGKYLEALAEGFRSGTLQFSSGKKAIRLRPTGLLELNLKAKRKGGEARLQIEVAWKEPKRRTKSTTPPLKIQTGKSE